MRLPAPILFVFCLFGAYQPLGAQTVMGRVTDSQTNSPVGRGFVIALDSNGVAVARTLTAMDGSFELRLPGAGRYQLRSERIAYQPQVTAYFLVMGSETVPVNMQIESLPVTLDAIEVEERTQCRINPEEGARTAVLWGEIRKALDGASWTGAQAGYRYRFLQFDRELDRRARRVLSERTNDRVGSYRAPFRTRAADWLAENGFVVEDQGSYWFYAPDADVIQHDAFLATHCFRVVRERNRQNMVGLEFRPIDDRKKPDVNGVLWLNESTAELMTLEFGYTELPSGIRDDRIGGTVHFLQLPNGGWIVREWVIRLPVVGLDANLSSEMLQRSQVAVRGYQDTGGEVVTVATARRDTVYMAPVAELTGAVYDESAATPLHGAEVEIVGTSYRTITNAAGEFRIAAFVNGEYGVTFSHPRTDSLGYTPEVSGVSLTRGQSAALRLVIPTPDLVFSSVCDMESDPAIRGILGTVTAAERPVPGATVHVVWQQDNASILEALQNDNVSVRSHGGSTTTDSSGAYRLCGVPSSTMLIVAAVTDTSWSQPTTVNFDTAGVWHMPTPCLDQSPNELLRAVANPGSDLRGRAQCFRTQQLIPSPDLLWKQDLRITGTLAQNTVLISGTVVQREDRSPLAEARVTVEPLGVSVMTEVDGSFEIPVGQREDLILVLEKEGHETVRHAIGSPDSRMIRLTGDVLVMSVSDRQGRRDDRSVISREAIAETQATTAAEVIRQLHPEWFRVRGTIRFVGNATIAVYVNNSPWGDVSTLESIRAEDIAEIRFYEPRDATTRFGTGHAAGAIQVMLNR